MGLQGFLHGGAERQLVVASVVDGHSFCPELVDIGTGFLLVVQNVNFGQFRIHRNRDEAAVACTVTGQKILPIGRVSKDALAQTVGRMGLVGNFIGFLLLTEETLDFLDALGIGSGDHLRHFDDPVTLQLAIYVVIVQPPQVIREPLVLDRQQPEESGLPRSRLSARSVLQNAYSILRSPLATRTPARPPDRAWFQICIPAGTLV